MTNLTCSINSPIFFFCWPFSIHLLICVAKFFRQTLSLCQDHSIIFVALWRRITCLSWHLLQTSQLCCGGQPGTNGIPGMHGIQGSPGRDGRDGRDGARGDRGLPGRTGPKGPAGAEGKKGDKGDPGVQGPAGQKGQQGEKGDIGTPASPQPFSHINWKECTWKHSDGKDQGLIRVEG